MRPQKDVYIHAAKSYDDMLEAYRDFRDDARDIQAYDAFFAAAMRLAQIGLPNPFYDLDGMTFVGDVVVRPSETNRVITSVLEESE